MHFIKYKGENLPVQIDFKVIKLVCAKHGITILDFQTAGANPEYLDTIVVESLKRGANLEGKEFNLTDEDIISILTESLSEFAVIFSECVTKIYADPDKKK